MPTYNIFINKDWPNSGDFTQIQGDFDDKQIAWDILKSLVDEQYDWASLEYNEGHSIYAFEHGPYAHLNIGMLKTKYTEYENLYDTYITNLKIIKDLEDHNRELAIRLEVLVKSNVK